MTAVPPFIAHPSQSTAVDLCNGYTYTFPPPVADASPIPPARLAIFDPQLLWDRLRAPIEQLFPLSSVVLRGKTGQVTISNVDVQLVPLHSSPVPPVVSSSAAALRLAASWHHLPYLHVYLLATSSYTAYIKHHRLLIAPFIAAFADSSSATTATPISPPPTSSSPTSSAPPGTDVLLLYCMHLDERKDSKGERKLLDKLRSDWGKDTVVPIVLADEWWQGWTVENGAGAAAAGIVGSEEGVMSSISSLFPSASSSNLSQPSAPPPTISASLLPPLRSRFTALFGTRCDSLHSLVQSLLQLSSYPHWPFTRFLLIQLAAARVHCQFGLYVEALRLLDESAAVMAGPAVQQLIGDAATQNKVKLRYLYDEDGGSSGRDDAKQADVEEVELFHNRLSLLQCERMLYAQQAAVLRRMGRIEEVVERGEALMARWMEREGWGVWGWLIGCVVDVWSRGEREIRERHANERRNKSGDGVRRDEEGKREEKRAKDEDSKEDKHKRNRLSTTVVRARSITPERRRHSPNPKSSKTAAHTADNKAQQSASDTDGASAASAALSISASSKPTSHKRSHTHRQSNISGTRGNHELTARLRQLYAQRVSSMFACLGRLLEERKRVDREKGRFDLFDEDGRLDGKRRRDRLRDDREDRERRLAEWKEREGDDYMLLLDDEVTGGEAVYEQRQRKVEYAMEHSCLFPLLLHALLHFTSPSGVHSYHFMSLYCHAFSALSLPSFASSLHLYLSSVYCWQHWQGLAVREMEWRLREESHARRWTSIAHSALLLLGLRSGWWLDIRIREMDEDVLGEEGSSGKTTGETEQWFCCVEQSTSGAWSVNDASSLLALFRHICIHHLPATVPPTSKPPSAPAYHRCRKLIADASSSSLTLPLPRPSVPSPAALPSLIQSSRASPVPIDNSIAFVVPLSSLVPIDSLTVTIHPSLSPLHLCLRLSFASASASVSPLASVLLDELAFTVSLQRRDDRMDIDCEYHQQVRLTGEELWLHAVMAAEGDDVVEVEASQSHHMCVLRLHGDDYSALQSLLDVSAEEDADPLLVSLSHIWLRYQRLHLLPFDRQVLQQALTVNIDYATKLAASTIASSSSAAAFLQPLFSAVQSTVSSPRASLAPLPLSLTFLHCSQPALINSTACVHLALQTTSPLPSSRLSLVDGGKLVGEVSMLVSDADGAVQERAVQVEKGTALLGPLSKPSLCVLECRVASPSPQSTTSEPVAADATYIARVSADSGMSVDLPFTIHFVPAFSVSCSLLRLGHRLFVCVVVRCSQPAALYEFDSVSIEWSKRWSVLTAAGEAELVGAVVAGGADVRLMYEVENEARGSEEARAEADALVAIRARVTSSSADGDTSTSPVASVVVSQLPLRLPVDSLRPPLLHLILSSPSSARVGQPITLSLTILLSAASSAADPSSSAVELLCCLVPSSAFYTAGHSAFTVRLSPASPSHSHAVVLLPLHAGAMLVPTIVVKEKRLEADGASGEQVEEWTEITDGRLQCHFGVERVQVLSSGFVHCELEQDVAQSEEGN